MPNPTVSVIIPTYNVVACIQRAIKSVQDQTFQDFEIVVVDDGSTDETVNVINALIEKDKRIRLFKLEKNSGPAVARNKGIKNAKGEWIALLDADDAFKPQRLEKLISKAVFLKLDMIADNVLLYDSTAKREVGTLLINPRESIIIIDLTDHLRSCTFKPSFFKSFRKVQFSTSQLHFIFKRKIIDDNNIIFPEHLRAAEDFYFYSLCLLYGAVAAIEPEPMYIYSQRYGSISQIKSSLTRTLDIEKPYVEQSGVEFLENFNTKLTKEQIECLLCRVNYGKARIDLAQIVVLIKKHCYTKAIQIFTMNPRVLVLLLQRLQVKLKHKITHLAIYDLWRSQQK